MSTPTPSTQVQTCPRPRADREQRACGRPVRQNGPRGSEWAGIRICGSCYWDLRPDNGRKRTRYRPTEPLGDLTARIPASLLKALDKEAKRQRRAKADLTRDALSDYLAQVGALTTVKPDEKGLASAHD